MEWSLETVVLLVNEVICYLRTTIWQCVAVSYMCWENYFAQLIIKVIGKRKPFKTNNSSEVLFGLHISNAPIAPTMGGERCNERFQRKLHRNSYHSKLC